jgi:hypothetical protein
LAGVLALGVREEPFEKGDKEKEETIAALKLKIKQLESEVANKAKNDGPRLQSFPFKSRNSDQNANDGRNNRKKKNFGNSNKDFKWYRSEREIAVNRVNLSQTGTYCGRCRKNNHNIADCWFNKFCSGCNRKGHTDDECYYRDQ